MLKSIFIAAAMFAAPTAQAQTSANSGPGCPAGTQYAAIRHSTVLPGKWATFEKAVADHQAWYARHDNSTTTVLVRVLAPRGSATKFLDSDALTITRYADKAPPPHDAGWDAFTAGYKASSSIKDEVRVCMPSAAH